MVVVVMSNEAGEFWENDFPSAMDSDKRAGKRLENVSGCLLFYAFRNRPPADSLRYGYVESSHRDLRGLRSH